MRTLFSSPRSFSVWRCTISHGQLLLRSSRSTSTGEWPTWIEVLFKAVDAVALPTTMAGGLDLVLLEVGAPLPHGVVARGRSRCVRVEASGHVVAGAAFLQETDLEFWKPSILAEPPFERPPPDGPIRCLFTAGDGD